MTQHIGLDLDRWKKLSLPEQMANIGMEVDRAMRWRAKKNEEYAKDANLRAVELFDLTINSYTNPSTLKEVCRAKEMWLDFFIGDNLYSQTESQWTRYFYAFNFLARNSSPL